MLHLKLVCPFEANQTCMSFMQLYCLLNVFPVGLFKLMLELYNISRTVYCQEITWTLQRFEPWVIHAWITMYPCVYRSTNWSSLVTVWVLVLPPCLLSSCAIPSPPCSATRSLHQGDSWGKAHCSPVQTADSGQTWAGSLEVQVFKYKMLLPHQLIAYCS